MKIEKTVDRGSKEKLYVQIYSIIREKIESKEWPSGTRIPPEDELCRIYDVSKVTVREAVQELAREGYLMRHQGKGTFVTYVVPQAGLMMRTRLVGNVFGERVESEKEVIESGFREAANDIRELLMAEPTDIYYILRRWNVDGCLVKEEIFVPSSVLPGLEKEDLSGTLYDLIEEKGLKKVFRIVQTVENTELEKDSAVLLGKPEGSRALLVCRTLAGSDGGPIAYIRLVGCGGKNRIKMEFERIK